VGSAGFIGSHLSDKLLAHGVQVVGVDDFSSGKNENLTECVRNKNFHLIRGSITESLEIKFPRLDYAFFVINSSIPEQIYREAFSKFLEICKGFKTKIVLVSSVDLYDNHRIKGLSNLKIAEEKLAGFSQENKANARVVRLSTIFGPRMSFNYDDPICRLVRSAVLDELQKEATPLDFTTRGIFIEDAVDLLVKAVMHGSTAQKIYDGVRLHPIKVTEIKQVLLDPLWHERRGFTPTELPPWPTPNITRTMKELSWKPKTPIVTALKETVVHFKGNPGLLREEEEIKGQEADRVKEGSEGAQKILDKKDEKPPEINPKDWGAKWKEIRETGTDIKTEVIKPPANDIKKISRVLKRYTTVWVVTVLVVLAFFYPVASIAIDAVSIRDHLTKSSEAISQGDFQAAEGRARLAKSRSASIQQMVKSMEFLEFANIFNPYLKKAGQLASLADEITDAAEHLAGGAQVLSTAIKVVSGETEGESGKLFETAGFEMDQADRQLALAQSRLGDEGQLKEFKANFGDFLSQLRRDVKRSRVAVSFLTQAIPAEGKRSYLVLLQDNTTLRPSGGVATAYAEVIFDSGKLLEVKTDSIKNFEAQVKDQVPPPADIQSDLGVSAWSLRDYGYSADFPANARLAQWFYRRGTEANPAGVIALDFTAASTLKALGTPSLNNNAEISSDTLKEVVNQVFFLSKQNWMDTGEVLDTALKGKHLLVYMSDPLFFSFLTSVGWVGILPEEGKGKVGEREGFLAFSEANILGNNLNKALKRSFNLESNIDKAGRVSYKLVVAYTNPDTSGSILQGTYKARLKVYLPAGTKLVRAGWGSKEITKEVKSFSDFGRAGYSMVLELQPREAKELVLEYQDGKSLSWEADTAKYKLQVIKQPGTGSDKFDFKLNSPSSPQIFSTDLSEDRLFEVVLKK